jgi:dethiobiotin synthetase
MTHIFVTASGTDIGKTVVSEILIRQLIAKGKEIAALKPVLSGLEGVPLEETDSGRMLSAMGTEISEDAIAAITPWRFDPPLSPDMAAVRAGQNLDLLDLMNFCLAPNGKDHVLIEGAGGVLVPINATATMSDWMQSLKARVELKVILVVGSYLGTISHTLTALESLKTRDLTPAVIVVSTSEVNPVPVEETAEVMARFVGNVPIAIVPRLENAEAPDLTQFLE